MTIRESTELWEKTYLSPYASCSCDSRGRDREEPECDIRPVYQRDRDRILHCKSFRRLKHKTQVFLTPQGHHYRTRLTHTLDVSQTARTISRALRLNEDLTEAIALGHDLGHTPFGHAGERALNKIFSEGFAHQKQSVRIVEMLEKGGRGLNLTWEVRDGILNHQTSLTPATLEGKIVRLSDKIAYINHDIDDALRSGIITTDDLPKECIRVLGDTHKKRIDTLVRDMIENSFEKPQAKLSEEKTQAMNELRSYMFQNVYLNRNVKKAEDLSKVRTIITVLFTYFSEHPDQLPAELAAMRGEFPDEELAKDHVAGMTDRYAVSLYEKLF